MAYRELELTLVSARELKNVNLIMRMDVYAVVTISGDPMTRQCTAPDPYGGRNPRWDATLRFAVPPTAAAAAGKCLHVLLRAARVLGDRDVGEVVIPLAELLAGAPAAGPQQPQVAAYQVHKVHRWEPCGVLTVLYRLGPVVAPVEVAEKKLPPVGVPSSQPFQPPADAYQRPAAPRAAAEAKQDPAPIPSPSSSPSPRNNGKKPPAEVMCVACPYPPVGVPLSQPFLPPADAYQPAPQPPPAPHPAAKAKHDPAPAPSPSPRLRLEGTQVTHIVLGGGGPATTMSSSPTGSNVSSPRKPYGAWPKQELHHGHDDTTYASAAQSIFSPRKEDHSRLKVFSDHDAQGRSETTSQRALVPASREPATVSPHAPSSRSPPPVSTFSSHGSSSSSPPYSPAHPFTSQRALVPASREPATVSPRGPSRQLPVSTFSSHSSSSPPPYSPAYPFTPSPISAHSSTNSPSPSPLARSVVGDAFGSSRATSHTNSPRSASTYRTAISSPLPSSPLQVANHTSMVPSR